MQLIEMVSRMEPATLRSVDHRIPKDLETIILKACDKEPKARYQSALALAEDLRRFMADEPIGARRVSSLEQVIRWARRNRALAAALGFVAALIVLMAVGSTIFGVQQSRLRKEAVDAKETAEQRDAERMLSLYFAEKKLGRAANWPRRWNGPISAAH